VIRADSRKEAVERAKKVTGSPGLAVQARENPEV